MGVLETMKGTQEVGALETMRGTREVGDFNTLGGGAINGRLSQEWSPD